MSTSQKTKGAFGSPLPLRERKIDLLFAVWYIIFLFTVTFTDLHNFTASVLGVEVKDLENMTLSYPPKSLTNIYFKWARTVDPLLYQNPMWWQVMEWVNLLTLMPFSIAAFFGFIAGWKWIKTPAIITNSWTFYSLLLCIFSTTFGPESERSPNLPIFLGAYVPYLVFPALIISRITISERPFATKLGRFHSFFLWTTSLITFFFFAAYSLEWFIQYHDAHEWVPEEYHHFLQGNSAFLGAVEDHISAHLDL